MKAKPNPYSVAKNDNIGRYKTQPSNPTNMGITNIVNAHRAKKRMEKVSIVADGVMIGGMREDAMQERQIVLRKK